MPALLSDKQKSAVLKAKEYLRGVVSEHLIVDLTDVALENPESKHTADGRDIVENVFYIAYRLSGGQRISGTQWDVGRIDAEERLMEVLADYTKKNTF